MHNNFYLLRQLSHELATLLKGALVSECFSQSKDELIIRFETQSKSFFIKASMQPAICCLSFPEEFNRARKNSIDLFPELIGKQVTAIRQIENERAFIMEFNTSYIVLFKMHGNRANIILFINNQAASLFRNNLIADMHADLTQLDKTIIWSKEEFVKNIHQLEKHFFTFGNLVWEYLKSQGFEDKSTEDKWELLQTIRKELEQPTYYIIEIQDRVVLSLLETGTILHTCTSATVALNTFFSVYSKQTGLDAEKTAWLARLRTQVKNGEAYLKKTSAKLKEIETDDHYRLWADLIMANLHRIEPGKKDIVLEDFTNHQPVHIKLKEGLNAQQNASIYYRKAKNQHIEIQKLKEAISKKNNELERLHELVQQLSKISSSTELKQFVRTSGISLTKTKKEEPLPYHEVEFQGFKIWIGKNAKSNDALTQRFAYKDDLWLHAKDVPGSHVLIKYQSGKPFPKPVVERAAALAAWHSKRKTESLCPVSTTLKKFVRKRKGDPPGTVIVEKENVILVEPKP